MLRILPSAPALWLALAATAHAVPLAYTDEATFLNDLAAAGLSVGTASFDSDADGAQVPFTTSGGLSIDITAPTTVTDVLGGPDLDVEVVALGAPFDPGTHVLGTDDPGNLDQFMANTSIAFTFDEPVTAFGLTLISGDSTSCCLFDGDVLLDVGAVGAPTAVLDVDAGDLLFTVNPGPSQTEVYGYFLGVNAEQPFTTVTLSYDALVPDAGFFFVLDDLTLAVPEPGTGFLVGSGLAAFALRRRNIRRGRTV